MDRFHNLPDEVLERIFIKGCEDDVGRTQDHPRQLKPFANLVSMVCSAWRQIILHPGEFQDTHFYAAVLTLALCFRESDRFRFSQPQRLVRDLAQFKLALSETRRCDIEITFSTDCRADSIEKLPGEMTAQILLFLNGMLSIIPYQQQILSLAPYADQPQVVAHFWQILDIYIREAPRFVQLTVEPIAWANELPPRSRYNHEVPRAFRPMVNSPPYASSGSIMHLVNLDSVYMDEMHWLEDPNHIMMATRLNVSRVPDIQKMLGIFHLRTDFFDNLVSLEISSSSRVSLDDLMAGAPVTQKFAFPSLRNLYLFVDHMIGEIFLQKTRYPSIEVIYLRLSNSNKVEPSTELEKCWLATCGKPQSPQHLYIFDVRLPLTWTSLLSVTNTLKSFSVEHLVLQGIDGKIPFREAVLRTRILETLLIVHPKGVTLDGFHYSDGIMLLTSINTSRLHTLTMIRSFDYRDAEEVKEEDTQEFTEHLVTSWGKPIIAPHLRSINQELSKWQPLWVHEHLLSSLISWTVEKIYVDARYSSHYMLRWHEVLGRLAEKAKAERNHITVHPHVQRLRYALNAKLIMDSYTLRHIFLQVPKAQVLQIKLYGLSSRKRVFATQPESDTSVTAFLDQVHPCSLGELAGLVGFLLSYLLPSLRVDNPGYLSRHYALWRSYSRSIPIFLGVTHAISWRSTYVRRSIFSSMLAPSWVPFNSLCSVQSCTASSLCVVGRFSHLSSSTRLQDDNL